jgi:hypothetical protein
MPKENLLALSLSLQFLGDIILKSMSKHVSIENVGISVNWCIL